ncbi:acetyl-CoA carboxylase biotin carboxylase subunit [Saccharopolyspora sp. NPDC003752]
MFRKLLVANRGEIAVRVVRACRDLGISTVAVYSEADANTLAVELADETVCIGPADSRASYLSIPAIIEAALKTGSDAIHPGYGFLAEDSDFAEVCAENGITFVGPPPEVMEEVADKAVVRAIMQEAGLEILPGSIGTVPSVRDAEEIASSIGMPVVVKASAGGGGRGISVVREHADLPTIFRTTRQTAQLLFKDSSVYVERYLNSARHVEVQVLCDGRGGAVHLGERDCSVQRRNQKLIEESPSPALDTASRERITELALRGAKAVDFQGAGTMEFIVDDDGRAYFMEINPRIQVEHPVSEAVTGIDVVREQILVASGAPLSFAQGDVVLRGHAIECRVNAEDPEHNFRPATGHLEQFRLPGGPGVRVDTHCSAGMPVSPHYDSLLAKLICWGEDREAALRRSRAALSEFLVRGAGVRTTIPFLREVLDTTAFRDGRATTGLVEEMMASAVAP